MKMKIILMSIFLMNEMLFGVNERAEMEKIRFPLKAILYSSLKMVGSIIERHPIEGDITFQNPWSLANYISKLVEPHLVDRKETLIYALESWKAQAPSFFPVLIMPFFGYEFELFISLDEIDERIRDLENQSLNNGDFFKPSYDRVIERLYFERNSCLVWQKTHPGIPAYNFPAKN